MRWLISLLLATVCGCSSVTGGADAGAGGAATGTACAPVGATCTSCTACALAGACAGLFNACQGNVDCMTIDQCFEGCSGDATCQQQCYADNPNGATQYQTLLQCVDSTECPGLCT